MSNDGLFTDGTDQFAPKVNSIPLSDVDTSSSETSVGQLVSNATEQMSQLVRSEVELAIQAAETLEAEGIPARVVSVPCMEWFLEQDQQYVESILPEEITARVSVEAAISMPWHRFTGLLGRNVSLEHYGASADYKTLYKEFGITAEAVVDAAKASINASLR